MAQSSWKLQFADEVSEQANLVMGQFKTTEPRLAEIRANEREDEVCRQVMTYCLEGWSTYPYLPGTLKAYWQVQNRTDYPTGTFVERSETHHSRLHAAGNVRQVTGRPPGRG